MSTTIAILSAFLIIDFVVGVIADLLNIGALGRPLPQEFAEVFDAELYKKSQDYTRAKTRFGILGSVASLAGTLTFLFVGGFDALDSLVRGFGFHVLVDGLIYIGALFFLQTLLALPFSIYDTFVIEERFGFNRTTVGTFIGDTLKNLGLGALLGAPLLLGVQALFLYAGSFAWLTAWAAITTYLLIMYFVTPIWLMPLFLKFTPLEDGELKEAIFALARQLSFPLGGIYVIDGSRRSSKANAFFVGFGKNKRIALYDTLIADQTIPEIVAVLGHEIGHYKKKHMLRTFAVSVLQMGVMLFLFSLFLAHPAITAALGVATPSVYAALVFFLLFYSFPEIILSVINTALSRKHEYEADAYAREHLGESEMLISGLKKLSKNNLANLTPHPFYVLLHYTHPPLVERFVALRKERPVTKA